MAGGADPSAPNKLGRSQPSVDELDAIVVELVDHVTRRLRSGGRVGRTIVLRLRFGDFTRATRSHSLERATAHTNTVLLTVRELLGDAAEMIAERGLTLVGVAVSNLDDHGTVQLTLPLDAQSTGALDSALDGVRGRFGAAAVTRAVLLGRDTGHPPPLLPD